MAWSSLVTLSFASPVLFNVKYYTDLLLFCGFVMYDTQAMLTSVPELNPIEREHAHMSSTTLLFMHLMSLFVFISIFLDKEAAKEKLQCIIGEDFEIDVDKE
ncbi:hypothetical protein AMAG_19334 [Allomyces macrogynus ATCC 38327]|uniref:Uncharacterized protein n=1 Tax=Allomyces macrogynus (strain ATCC 38327) TaxID=578462 RepID=A0A0L0SU42_ALLM3|nr:hypothetical protein AMAG_19334 [Allomyces macrogynus ATCC 38327]|eukprot:KNE66078.1 hypothetical protein AMAG_19334 [Allomyces macrogynus ATCC 38327]